MAAGRLTGTGASRGTSLWVLPTLAVLGCGGSDHFAPKPAFYNHPASLDILRANAHELAAVMIELPRSRRPDIQPTEFLGHIREITERSGTALIFDEVVTGFRLHPGGAQALFGVRADIVTYGKAVAAGMPIGVIAGRSKYLDAIDGGHWNYGDDSYPRAETTLFVGTYFKHPLVMAAGWTTPARRAQRADGANGQNAQPVF